MTLQRNVILSCTLPNHGVQMLVPKAAYEQSETCCTVYQSRSASCAGDFLSPDNIHITIQGLEDPAQPQPKEQNTGGAACAPLQQQVMQVRCCSFIVCVHLDALAVIWGLAIVNPSHPRFCLGAC